MHLDVDEIVLVINPSGPLPCCALLCFAADDCPLDMDEVLPFLNHTGPLSCELPDVDGGWWWRRSCQRPAAL